MRGCYDPDDDTPLWHGALLPFAIVVAVVFVIVTSGCAS